MRIEPYDGVCRSCRGPHDIIDHSDVSLSVACAECGDSYEVETDAFDDGGVKYQLALVLQGSREDSVDEN